MKKSEQAIETRNRILHVAMDTIRTKGFASTRIDDICQAAGITKGAFFHHFKSKDDMAAAAAQYFSDFAETLFSTADFQKIEDPYLRFLGYIDLREGILQGEAPAYTCLLGTMVQEVHTTHPAIREACHTHIWGHAQTLVPMIQEALDQRQIKDIDAQELALYTQAVLQGAFVLSKASQTPQTAKASVKHLRRYIQTIFEN